jgi:2-C-methyl-D-erythritol 2,4-cyclodiphosphate synthase
MEMLRTAVARVESLGWRVQQVDVAVIAERPRIAPYRDGMRARLADALGVGVDAVSVKGKTNEGMGWIGREEGIACIAVATVVSLTGQS